MRRRRTAIFFLVFGICLSALAIALNVGWILLNLREVVVLVLGIIFFAVIITGLILNTIFLLREIRRNEQQDAFLNAVTHELRTPIASIKLYLETLRSRAVDEKKQHEFYDTMLSDTDRLMHTVDQVLSASRIRTERKKPAAEEVSVNALVTEAVDIVRSRYNLSESVFRVAEAKEDVRVAGDAEELRTAFVNLLDNAVKYSGDDPKVAIRIRLSSLRSRVLVFIRDNGIGIAPHELRRIFKRFYRVSDGPGKKTKGSGLGLFLVRTIIKRHGGHVWAESKGTGRGATLRVQLPVI